MAERRHGAGQAKTKFQVEYLFNLAATILALVALYFSWDANQIARKQITAQLIVLRVEDAGRGFEAARVPIGIGAACNQRIWIHNLGGAPGSVFTWRTIYYYNGKEIDGVKAVPGLISSQENLYDLDVVSAPGIDLTSAWEEQPTPFRLKLPLRVQEYSTYIFLGRVWFNFTPDIVQAQDPIFLNPKEFNPELWGHVEDYTPLDVAYEFTLTDGKKILSPRSLCMYLRER